MRFSAANSSKSSGFSTALHRARKVPFWLSALRWLYLCVFLSLIVPDNDLRVYIQVIDDE
jgi:hypothetical protein